MKSQRGHFAAIAGAVAALVMTALLLGLGVGTASAADTGTSGIVLGANGPTTTITADGAPIELIPAASAELPPETPTAATAAQQTTAAAAGIEVQGVSSSTGPTASAGVDGQGAIAWVVIGAVVVLGGLAFAFTRIRSAARH